MPPDELLDRLVDLVGDRAAVDWTDAHVEHVSAESRAEVEALRLIDAVQNFHYSQVALDPDAEPGMPRLLNERWGKYFLREMLGSGTFGTVYRAWDPDLEQSVALKILHADLAGSLVEEARRLGQVGWGNPRIVSVLGIEHFRGRSAICMEFIRGRTLSAMVEREGPLGVRGAAEIGATVCRALAAVHKAGLVHRDVKAANVMRSDEGRVVLMDFGSGVRVGDAATVGAAGTPLYMAPEVLEGEPATARHDLYSVGVLLWYLVSGRHPAEGESIGDLKAVHRARPDKSLAKVRPDLPARFTRLVDQAIHPDAHQRFHSADVMAAELEAVARRASRRERLQRVAVAAGVTTLSLVALAFAAGFLTSKNYQYLLGITGPFATETPLEYLNMGRLSLFAPAVAAGMVTFALYLILELAGILARLSQPLQRLHTRWRDRLDHALASRPLGIRDLAAGFALLTVVFLIWVPLVQYPQMTSTFLGQHTLSDAPVEALRRLGPAGYADQTAYRATFAFAIPVMCAGWLVLHRSARRRGTSLGTVGWIGLAAIAANALFMSIPYRVFIKNQAPKAMYAGEVCYVTAESTESALLFCPHSIPRVRSTAKSDPSLARTGTVGSLFEDVR